MANAGRTSRSRVATEWKYGSGGAQRYELLEVAKSEAEGNIQRISNLATNQFSLARVNIE